MDAQEFFSWIKDNGLSYVVKGNYMPFKRVFKECLCVNKEKVLILSDYGYPQRRIAPIMAACYLMAARELNLNVDFVIQEPRTTGVMANDNIIEQLLKLDDGNVVVVCLSGSLGQLKIIGKSFRKYAIKKKHRFVSTPHLSSLDTCSFKYLVDAIDVNYKRLMEKGYRIKQQLDLADEIKVVTRKGTNVTFDIKNMEAVANVGDYHKTSSGGNLPVGEVYIPPRGKGVNGKVVLDGSLKIKEGVILLKQPVTLKIEEGMVTKIIGNRSAELLEKTLDWAYMKSNRSKSVRMIGEFGIGINQKADLVGPTIINEKTYGTAHIAIGSNYWFGGDIHALIHLDQVFKEPVIRLDGKLLVI